VGGARARSSPSARRDDAVAAFGDGHLDLAGARALVERAEAKLPGEEKLALLRCDLEEADFDARLDASAPYAELAAAAERVRAALDRARQVNPADPSLPQREAALENELHLPHGPQQGLGALDRGPAGGARARPARRRVALAARATSRSAPAARAARRADRDRLQLEPDYALAWDGLARLLESDGDLEGALHAYVRAEEALLKLRDQGPLSPSRAAALFYRNNLETVDLPAVRAHIRSLRQTLYF
jgi:hypothetical protein